VQVIQCICGERLEARDYDQLLPELLAHNNEAHADLELDEDQLREILAKGAGTTRWDGTRRELPDEVEIHPLTPGRLGDYLGFFDRDAFMDNPDWSSCYCLFYHFEGDDWETRTGEQNRTDKAALISQGRAKGLLAYVQGRPVAWCNAGPKRTLPRIANDEDLRSEDDETVGSIVCFVVAAPYRRQGVARRLLEAACDYLKRLGMTVAEAYPPKDAASDARSYHGPLAMYLDAGFEAIGEAGHGYQVVRRSLAG
jgi:GNAT superfamily N-acetyltransferase